MFLKRLTFAKPRMLNLQNNSLSKVCDEKPEMNFRAFLVCNVDIVDFVG